MKTKLIILAIVIIVLGGGWYYYKNYSTLGWNKYADTEWNFELKYPPNFNFEARNPKHSNSFTTTGLVQIWHPEGKFEREWNGFQVNLHSTQLVHQGELYSDPYKFAEKLYESFKDKPILKKIKISGLDAVEVQFPIGMLDFAERSYLIIKDGFVYEVSWDLDFPEMTKIANSFELTN